MKAIHHVAILTLSLLLAGNTLASAVSPLATGQVQSVGAGVTSATVTVNGKSYTLTNNTKTDDGNGWPQPGQLVTLILAPDGQTVIAVHRAYNNADSTAPQP